MTDNERSAATGRASAGTGDVACPLCHYPMQELYPEWFNLETDTVPFECDLHGIWVFGCGKLVALDQLEQADEATERYSNDLEAMRAWVVGRYDAS